MGGRVGGWKVVVVVSGGGVAGRSPPRIFHLLLVINLFLHCSLIVFHPWSSKGVESSSTEDLEAGTNKQRLPAEPTLPLYLKFTDVTYKVVLKGVTSTVEKDILNGITGSVDPGEVLALMGPSVSGKTTLLSLLGGRVREPTPGGTVTYNDQPYTKYLKSRIGLVTQDDVLFTHLTRLSREEKEKRAMDVIYDLGLETCQDTMIGGSFVRGASGGERK
ncbi:ATP-binding cassette [Lithospermum erythrorhizon]|uniref:ATP-binding cassette n=1 Tax=Lithospermum erythrorhizon TaxID=34254 RepID=A0AAV3PTJ8_LITER